MSDLKPIIFILMLGNIAFLIYHMIMLSKGEGNFGSLMFTIIAISVCLLALTKDD